MKKVGVVLLSIDKFWASLQRFANSSARNVKLILILSSLPVICFASLGDNLDSIANDKKNLGLSDVSQISAFVQTGDAKSQVSQFMTEKNISIKEFSNNGVVYAVSWSGHINPNLRQLLGKYFPQLKTAVRVSMGNTHSVLSGDDFSYQSSGYPGNYSGIAYIPSLIPAGVSLNDLH